MAFKKGVLNVKVLGTLKIHLPIDGKIPSLSSILRKDAYMNIKVMVGTTLIDLLTRMD